LPERTLKFNVFLFPMIAYRNLFNRGYMALSTNRRRVALAIAGGIVPREELDAAIELIDRHGRAFAEYFREDITVNIRQGYHPPLMDGYRLYQESSGRTVEEPPVAPASSLLKGTHWLESWVLKAQSPVPERPLKWIRWEEAGENAALSHWDWLVNLNYSALHGLTLESLPATVANIDPFASKTWAHNETDEMRRWYAQEVLITAFGCALYRAGWKLDYAPGSWSLRLGETRITPRHIIGEISQAAGTREPGDTQERWIQLLERLQLEPAMSLAARKEEQVPLES
jgi:hypothetical protein